MFRQWIAKLTAAATLVALVWAPAAAQDNFPSRSLRIVVPTSPGSGSDTVGRFFAEQLSSVLGQAVVVENRAGGNGVIAAMAVKQAPADGYTLFLGTNTHLAVNPVVIKDIPYDALKDLKPISGLTRGMMVLVSSASNPRLQTLADLVQAGRDSQKKLNVGTYTAGFHLSAEWFGALTKTHHVNVPYRGAPEVFLALLGNQIDWAVSDLIAAMPQVRSGKLRALAVTGDVRHPDYPEIPTAKELGYPEYVNYTWTTLTVRSETPEAVTNRLVEAVQKVMALPATKEFTRKIGSDPLALATSDMRRFQLTEIERFRAVAASAGIKPQ
jgi:tripartite-type tricarboxylate transporter receptor subunit TctC